MTEIAILDDDKSICEKVRQCVLAAIPEGCHVHIEICTSPSELWKYIEEKLVDILITDIEMPEMSGMELGRKVREKYEKMYLIFLTAHPEYAYESYRISAYQYIDKSDMEERLPKLIETLAIRLEKEKTQFRWIGTGEQKQKIYYADIIYLHKAKGEKYVEYVTEKEIYRERINIREIEKEVIERGFLTIERGYIANIRHIAGIGKTTIRMDNGDELAVSRARRAKVKEELNHRWRELE
jgi:DNA-binding LytR/AlgR family response regulator